jgi:hypothetical protein
VNLECDVYNVVPLVKIILPFERRVWARPVFIPILQLHRTSPAALTPSHALIIASLT